MVTDSVALLPNGDLSLEAISAPGATQVTPFTVSLQKALNKGSGAFLWVLATAPKSEWQSPTLKYWATFAGAFSRHLLLHPEVERLRQKTPTQLSAEIAAMSMDLAPPMQGGEYLNPMVLQGHWKAMHQVFVEEIGTYDGPVEAWVLGHGKNHPRFQSHGAGEKDADSGHVHFHLVEHKNDDYPFAFLATYGSKSGVENRWRHVPLRQALEEFKGDTRGHLQLLKSLEVAASKSVWLGELVQSGEIFQPLLWKSDQALAFLQGVEEFELSGILCRIPDFWRRARTGARVKIKTGQTSKGDSLMGLDTLVTLGLSLEIGGVEVSAQVLENLGHEPGLIQLKGQWVAVDADNVKQAQDLLAKARALTHSGSMTLAEALKLLTGSAEGSLGTLAGNGSVEVTSGEWLENLLCSLRDPSLAREIKPSPNLNAKLRPYQKLGLSWLRLLHDMGFGACLADDMGLGKTVQVLALLQSLKDSQADAKTKGSPKAKPDVLNVLLVVPASLLFNWVTEMERFTPGLTLHVVHSAFGGASPPKKKVDVVLTTYAMLERSEWLTDKAWSLAIIDEAQAIKNPTSKQTRAVKKLQANRRLALTGTPIENRLTDLWSLFDFLNPGLLGNMNQFLALQKRLDNDPAGHGRLRKVIMPFLLRRMKSDKNLLPDLPDKIEMRVTAEPTGAQASLYRKVSQELMHRIENSQGIQRRGLVLSALIQFKQICNHPDHFLGAGKYREADSGKFTLLREICEPIRDKHERVLIFTQFAEITEPLARFLSEIFGREGLVLTGATPVTKRRALVERFQGDAWVPFMVLSLKAGGVGLNLTRASHVIHFDRWWNPAVENQATDRAHRLGQGNTVMVHKFVMRGTLEERIETLLAKKGDLFHSVIASGGESWVTDMSNAELKQLFSLSHLDESAA